MNSAECDILYIAGTFDYGTSVSGNYIMYKCIKSIKDARTTVLPLFENTKFTIDSSEFLPFLGYDLKRISSEELINNLPKHKVLIMSGDDLTEEQIVKVCTHFNSKLVTITMTHWIFGDTSYPELDGYLEGESTKNRLKAYTEVGTTVIVGSSHSKRVMEKSLFKDLGCALIPFPLEEIDVDTSEVVVTGKKVILWGTTQPETRRKGKVEFEQILSELYLMCENPEDIVIHQIGPRTHIDTKFQVEHLGVVADRRALSKIYRGGNVFAQTTLSDAGPMMTVECLWNSTPVVSFDTNIASDLVDNGINGYIVETSKEFAQKIYDILYQGSYEFDMEKIKDFNNISKVYDLYNKLYQSIISK